MSLGACARRNPPSLPRSDLIIPRSRSGTTMRLMNFSEIPCASAISLIVRGRACVS